MYVKLYSSTGETWGFHGYTDVGPEIDKIKKYIKYEIDDIRKSINQIESRAEEDNSIDVKKYMDDCLTLTLIRAKKNEKGLPWHIDREKGIARLESIEIKVNNIDEYKFLPVSYREIGKKANEIVFNKELFEDGLYAYYKVNPYDRYIHYDGFCKSYCTSFCCSPLYKH